MIMLVHLVVVLLLTCATRFGKDYSKPSASTPSSHHYSLVAQSGGNMAIEIDTGRLCRHRTGNGPLTGDSCPTTSPVPLKHTEAAPRRCKATATSGQPCKAKPYKNV